MAEHEFRFTPVSTLIRFINVKFSDEKSDLFLLGDLSDWGQRRHKETLGGDFYDPGQEDWD